MESVAASVPALSVVCLLVLGGLHGPVWLVFPVAFAMLWGSYMLDGPASRYKRRVFRVNFPIYAVVSALVYAVGYGVGMVFH